MVYFAMSNEYAARSSSIGSPFNIKTLGTIKEITEILPYQLTKDQKDTVNSMIQKVRVGKRLNALVASRLSRRYPAPSSLRLTSRSSFMLSARRLRSSC